MSFSSSSSSSSISPLLILLILSAILCGTAFSQNDVQREAFSCSDYFPNLNCKEMNITNGKSLRTLDAVFGWNVVLDRQNGTNGSTFGLDVMFGATLEMGPPAWIAWGVNPEKRPEMIGTKAIIGIIPKTENSGMEVRTYEITKETRMGCHLEESPHLAGVQVKNTTIWYDQAKGLYIVSARLVLNATMYNVSRLGHVWQIGYKLRNDDNNPQSHPTTLRNVDSTETIDLIHSVSYGQNRALLRKVHGALNIAGWGTFLPIGVIVARYFRVYPFQCKKWWFYLHIACQSAGYVMGTAGWAIGLWLGRASRYYIFHTHRTFAIIIFTFTTIQMLALRLKPTEKDEYRKYWNMYHHFLGYGLLVIIIMNIFKGISILQAGKGWKWAYIGILALLGAIILGLEIFTWGKFLYYKHKAKKREPENQQKAEDENKRSEAGDKS